MLITAELEHIEKWSTANNLKLNHSKTHEILFVARGIRGSRAVLPHPVPGIARVDSIKAVGGVVNDRMTVVDQVDSLIAACVKSLYALKVLRSHGMPTLAPHRLSGTCLDQVDLLFLCMVWFLHSQRGWTGA